MPPPPPVPEHVSPACLHSPRAVSVECQQCHLGVSCVSVVCARRRSARNALSPATCTTLSRALRELRGAGPLSGASAAPLSVSGADRRHSAQSSCGRSAFSERTHTEQCIRIHIHSSSARCALKGLSVCCSRTWEERQRFAISNLVVFLISN